MLGQGVRVWGHKGVLLLVQQSLWAVEGVCGRCISIDQARWPEF